MRPCQYPGQLPRGRAPTGRRGDRLAAARRRNRDLQTAPRRDGQCRPDRRCLGLDRRHHRRRTRHLLPPGPCAGRVDRLRGARAVSPRSRTDRQAALRDGLANAHARSMAQPAAARNPRAGVHAWSLSRVVARSHGHESPDIRGAAPRPALRMEPARLEPQSQRSPRMIARLRSIVGLGYLIALLALPAGVPAQDRPAAFDFNFDTATTAIHWTLDTNTHVVHGTFRLKTGRVHIDPVTGEANGLIVIDA